MHTHQFNVLQLYRNCLSGLLDLDIFLTEAGQSCGFANIGWPIGVCKAHALFLNAVALVILQAFVLVFKIKITHHFAQKETYQLQFEKWDRLMEMIFSHVWPQIIFWHWWHSYTLQLQTTPWWTRCGNRQLRLSGDTALCGWDRGWDIFMVRRQCNCWNNRALLNFWIHWRVLRH